MLGIERYALLWGQVELVSFGVMVGIDIMCQGAYSCGILFYVLCWRVSSQWSHFQHGNMVWSEQGHNQKLKTSVFKICFFWEKLFSPKNYIKISEQVKVQTETDAKMISSSWVQSLNVHYCCWCVFSRIQMLAHEGPNAGRCWWLKTTATSK